MIITDKQITQMMELLHTLAMNSPMTVIPRKAMELLDVIRNQQENENDKNILVCSQEYNRDTMP